MSCLSLFFKKLYNLVVCTLALGAQQSEKTFEHSLITIAEYRSAYFNPDGDGINLKKLEKDIQNIGFQKIKIITHSDTANLFQNTSFDYFRNCLKALGQLHQYGVLSNLIGTLGFRPYFAVIAQK